MGVVAILAASALMPFADDTTPLIPIPAHQFLMYLFLSFAYLVFLPALYVASYSLLRSRRWFGPAVLMAAIVLAGLDALYFRWRWADGLGYPGERFTRVVALENGIAFALVIAFAAAGVSRRSPTMTNAAHLLLFVVLGWCAFPLLGRFDL
jgi:hypothetical protein